MINLFDFMQTILLNNTWTFHSVMFFSAHLTVSKCLLILQCLLVCISTLAFENSLYECTKPPGESYGSRIQKLEDSMVYKLDHPDKTQWKKLLEEIEECLNMTSDFFLWLKLDDKEEIKYAQQFLKNGVPQIVTRNFTASSLLKKFQFDVYQMLMVLNAIRKLNKAWEVFRDPYFQECYNNEEYYKKLIEKYEAEGYPELKITTDDETWPLNEEDYPEGHPMRLRIAAEKKGNKVF